MPSIPSTPVPRNYGSAKEAGSGLEPLARLVTPLWRNCACGGRQVSLIACGKVLILVRLRRPNDTPLFVLADPPHNGLRDILVDLQARASHPAIPDAENKPNKA